MLFWKNKFNLNAFLEKYHQIKSNDFAASQFIETFPTNKKLYKPQLLSLIDTKIKNKDSEDLDLYLGLAWRDGLDDDYKSRFKEIILANWHNFHEDIVDYVREFRDNIFTDELYIIAKSKFPYRKYDDENEATLRKCVLALKEINSEESLNKIKLLQETGNVNVKYTLDMYK